MITSLNDPQEISYGTRIVENEISRLIEQDGVKEKDFLTMLRSQVRMFSGRLVDTWISCFCETGDLLSQWRAYGDLGGGYALKFNFSDATRMIAMQELKDSDLSTKPEPTLAPVLRKVIYDRDEQTRMAADFIHQSVQAVESARKGSINSLHPQERMGFDAWLAADAANYLFDLILSFKDSAFKEEQEWRLIRVLPDTEKAEQIEFREVGPRLVPYRPTCLFDQANEPVTLPLSEITLGPTLDPAEAGPAISVLLRHEESRIHPIKVLGYANVRSSTARLR
ncbi:MAG: DUF2971 domain-containing protein [Bacteroidota bacterium]